MCSHPVVGDVLLFISSLKKSLDTLGRSLQCDWPQSRLGSRACLLLRLRFEYRASDAAPVPPGLEPEARDGCGAELDTDRQTQILRLGYHLLDDPESVSHGPGALHCLAHRLLEIGDLGGAFGEHSEHAVADIPDLPAAEIIEHVPELFADDVEQPDGLRGLFVVHMLPDILGEAVDVGEDHRHSHPLRVLRGQQLEVQVFQWWCRP